MLPPQSILRQLSCVLLHYVAFAYPKANNMQSSEKKIDILLVGMRK